MIHQTYHDPLTREKLFSCHKDHMEAHPYSAFDLLSLGLPEKIQTQLCEYAALRWLYEHPEADQDAWIGFTSVNQRTPTRFESAAQLESLFQQGADAVCWGWHVFHDGACGMGVTLADAGERCHPGLNALLKRLLHLAGEPGLPAFYTTSSQGPFCNYWAMPKERFREYMEWSLPLVEYCLRHLDEPFFQRWPRGVAYLAERLWLCWQNRKHLKVAIVNNPPHQVLVKPARRSGERQQVDVSVIIPSKLDKNPAGAYWLEKAIASVQAQESRPREILVALDKDEVLPEVLARFGCQVVHGPGKGHQQAMNAAAQVALGQHLCFLEDDDWWLPGHLAAVLKAAHLGFRFVGCSQTQWQDGQFHDVLDFPTASGWCVERDLWQQMGGVDTSFKIHHDNAFLCKLQASKVRNAHLIEKGAQLPWHEWEEEVNGEKVKLRKNVRRWFLDQISRRATILMSDEWEIQVQRAVHAGSVMGQVYSGARADTSRLEKDKLRAEYGTEGF